MKTDLYSSDLSKFYKYYKLNKINVKRKTQKELGRVVDRKKGIESTEFVLRCRPWDSFSWRY